MNNRTLLIATSVVALTAGSLVYAQSVTPEIPLVQDIQNVLISDTEDRDGKRDCGKHDREKDHDDDDANETDEGEDDDSTDA